MATYKAHPRINRGAAPQAQTSTEAAQQAKAIPTSSAQTGMPIGAPPTLSFDITYIQTGEGWLYLAVVVDLCAEKWWAGR